MYIQKAIPISNIPIQKDSCSGSRLQVLSRRPPPTQRDPEPASPSASPPFTAFSAVPNARRRPAASSFGVQDEAEDDPIQVPPSNFGARGSSLR